MLHYKQCKCYMIVDLKLVLFSLFFSSYMQIFLGKCSFNYYITCGVYYQKIGGSL